MHINKILGRNKLRRKALRQRAWRVLNIVVAVTTLVNLSALGAFIRPQVANAASAIWTTRVTCLTPAPQDENEYANGDTVYVRGGAGVFAPSTVVYGKITGQPGGASSDPSQIVKEFQATTDGTGYFCVDAYIVGSDGDLDDGVYSVDVYDNPAYDGTGDKIHKNDNYHANAQVGSVTVTKDVVNDDKGSKDDHDFTMRIKSSSTDFVTPFAGDKHGSTYSLPTGTYVVSEDSPTSLGYQQESIVCDGQSTNTITVTNGSDHSCVITNNDIAPQLTVIKHVINDNGGSKVASNFKMHVVASGVSDTNFPGDEAGTTVTMHQGSYSVFENGLLGYAMSSYDGCSGTIYVGEHKTCTITNIDLQPTLKVVKVVVGGTKEVSDFPLFVDKTPVISGGTNSFNKGTYTVSETGDSSYTAEFSGDCDASGMVSLDIGDKLKTCTLTNTAIDVPTYRLHGQKFSDLNGSHTWNEGEPALNGWTVFIDDNENGSLDTGERSMVTQNHNDQDGWYWFDGVVAGSYQVCEVAQSGWTQTSPVTANGCHTVTVPTPGANDTCQSLAMLNAVGDAPSICNFGNQEQASVKVIKNIDLNGDGDTGDTGIDILGATDWTWDANSGGQNYATGLTAQYLTPGLTTISEDQKIGYTMADVKCGPDQTLERNVMFLQGTINPNSTTLMTEPGGHYTCTFTNARDTGTLILAKSLTGGPAVNYTGPFTIHYDCGVGFNGDRTVSAGGSQNVSGIPTGTSCTVSEPSLPTAPTGYTFGVPTFSPSATTTIPSGNGSAVTVTTNNSLTRDTGTIELKKLWSGAAGQTTLKIGTATGSSDIASQLTGAAGVAPLTTGMMTVPTGTYFVSESAIEGYTTSLACTDDGATVTPGTSVSLPVAKGHAIVCTYTNTKIVIPPATVTVTIPTPAVTITPTPRVLGATTGPELTLTKTVNVSKTNPGKTLTYTLVVANTGTGSASNVVVTDTLPVGFTFVDGGKDTKSWTYATLAAGASQTITAKVKVGTGVKAGDFTNRAQVTADGLDPVNATAVVSVSVPKILGLATTGAGWRDYLIFLFGSALIAVGFVMTKRNRRELGLKA